MSSFISAQQYLCELGDSRYSALVMPKKVIFSIKKMKGRFVYVLEFMLTLAKCKISVHKYAKNQNLSQSILKVIY